jgi:hypothetical protein
MQRLSHGISSQQRSSRSSPAMRRQAAAASSSSRHQKRRSQFLLWSTASLGCPSSGPRQNSMSLLPCFKSRSSEIFCGVRTDWFRSLNSSTGRPPLFEQNSNCQRRPTARSAFAIQKRRLPSLPLSSVRMRPQPRWAMGTSFTGVPSMEEMSYTARPRQVPKTFLSSNGPQWTRRSAIEPHSASTSLAYDLSRIFSNSLMPMARRVCALLRLTWLMQRA